MEPRSPGKTVTFRDITEKKDVTLSEPGDFLIGLSTNGDLTVASHEDDLCMTLLAFTLHENGGCTLSPASNDLACFINNSPEPLTSEIHLLDGTRLEIADKKLQFVDGPAPAQRRRKLPRTPGQVVGEPPPKPDRGHGTDGKTHSAEAETAAETKPEPTQTDSGGTTGAELEDEDERWLERSWCMLELSDSDQGKIKGLHTPEQISILTASYFTKQLRLFTDATITAQLLDDIFKLFMDAYEFAREIYMSYLSDVSEALAKGPDKTHTRPMHGPAVKFLTELLKVCCEPVERVALILDMLRTFSHFDNNLVTMVNCQTTAAVLGSMSANQNSAEVQRQGMDILAKIAKYQPQLNKKAPLREVGLDMILLGIKQHDKDLPLARSACRVLANMAATLNTGLNFWLDTEDARNADVVSEVEKYEQLLEYVFQQGIPVVQGTMKTFGSDLGVNTEGRRFIFFYSKLPQLQLKKTSWLKRVPSDSVAVQDEDTDGSKNNDEDTGGEFVEIDANKRQLLLEEDRMEEEPKSILKRTGSFGNQRSSQKRIVFADATADGSDSDGSSSASEGERLSPEGCTEADADDKDEVFSKHVVKHFVKQTLRRRSESAQTGDQLEFSEESDDEHEFLRSLSSDKENTGDSRLSGSSAIETLDSNKVNGGKEETVQIETTSLLTRDRCSKDNDTEVIDTETATRDLADEGCVQQTSGENIDHTDGLSDIKEMERSMSDDAKESAIRDVTFLGKLVRTQIIAYVGSLVFQGEDSTVLMVIDKPIQALLIDARAPPELIVFARNQYGEKMTLMDLEPSIVISVIDAVRYRSVTQELVQSAVLNLTRSLTADLLPATVGITMQFLKTLFADPHLKSILTEEGFVSDYKTCFQQATERMQKSHNIDDIRQQLAGQTFET